MLKRFLSASTDKRYLEIGIFILRVCIACFMLTHGWKKMDKLFYSDGPVKFSDPLGIGTIPSLTLAVFAEVFCSFLLLAGLFTRFALIPLIITMLVAVIFVQLPKGIGEMEFALHYLLIYFILFITGGGKYSLDHLLEKNKKTESEPV